MGIMIAILFAIVSLAAAVFLAIKYFGLVKRFKPVLSLDEEAARIQQEIDRAKGRARKLEDSYAQAKQVHDRIQQESALLQEDLEDMSFGLYKPHYDFEASEGYKAALEGVYDRKKAMIRADGAANYPTNWTVNNSKKEGLRMTKNQVKLMLRAFNGECDAATAKVTWNNATRMEERIRKAFEVINALGVVNRISITPAYLDLCLSELRLTHEYEQKKQDEKEEQKAIREQMREEERAQKEFEMAQRDAAVERDRAEKALAAARAELQKASGEHLEAIQRKIEELEQKVADAQAKQDRAVSMAQVTKMGHVYVISNFGSFGEDVFKIGMTRRLEPAERIQELSGASVPFSFDVHAMIFSDDAPGLECALHRQFSGKRLNLVNLRKEYFRVSLNEIETFAKAQGVTLEFTKLAEARQFRESEALRLKALQTGEVLAPVEDAFPEALFAGAGIDEE